MDIYLLRAGLLALALLPLQYGHAQSVDGDLAACESAASDADGDGFGWEIDLTTNDYGSCLVTADSAPKPTITNRQTGAEVELIRAFWDANNDIARRRIHCEQFEFNQTTAVYEKIHQQLNDTQLWHLYGAFYYHESLSSELPRMATMFRFTEHLLPEDGAISELPVTDPLWESGLSGHLPLWTVNDGIYYGASPLRFSPYIETVDHASGNANAIRVWANYTSDVTSQSYYRCYAADGQPLAPTGAPGVAATPFVSLDNTPITMPGELPPLDPVLNKETGQLVEFTDSQWNYNQQFAMRNFQCVEHRWEWRESSVYGAVDLDDSLAGWNYIFHPYSGGDSVLVTRQSYTSRDRPYRDWITKKVPIVNGKLGDWTEYDLPLLPGWEQLQNGLRIWNVGDNNLYRECSVSKLTQLNGQGTFLSTVESFDPPAQPQVSQPRGGGGGSMNAHTLYVLFFICSLLSTRNALRRNLWC